ncbi:MAG: hypothetical protein NTU98_13685 [Bacteroidetes bacterium]|nr:hypothetical protein [Bacteroidota bacterium]
MKNKKRIIIYSGLALLFVIFLFSANYIFNVLIRVDKEAKLVTMSLPAETGKIRYGIDLVKTEKLKWKKALYVNGWVFEENVNKDKRDVFMVLKNKMETLVFQVENNNFSRPDVSKGYHLVTGVNSHGFDVYIPMFRLKSAYYKIGFVIDDETGRYFSMSENELRILKDSVSLKMVKTVYQPVSQQVALNFQNATDKVSHSFDIVETKGQFLTAIGWGFIQGLAGKGLKFYVLLKKGDKVIAYDTKVQYRPDITKGFNKYGLNLDSTGFLARIPLQTLENGHYQFGLYIVAGDKNGMIYSKKSVDINK